MTGGLFIALYALTFVAMLGLWRYWPKSGPVWPIVLLAVVLRTVLLPLPPDDDVYRYIWEGKIQNAGFNPYVLAPDSPRLAPLRDYTWERVNHKNIPTIYGPFAEIVFRLCAATTHSPLYFKIIFIAFDLGAIFFLMLLMRTWSMEPRHLILYALNPLVLYATAGQGHLESIMLFWLAGALFFFRKKMHGLTFLFFGLAVAVKLTPIILLPFLINRKNVWFSSAALLAPALLYSMYAAPGLSFLSVPLRFATGFHFNGFASTILSWFVPFSSAVPLCALLLAIILLYLFFFIADPFRAVMLASAAFIFCSPTVHPWYLLPVIIFLPFYRSIPLLALNLTIGAAALVSIHYVNTGMWHESWPLWAAVYLPFAGVALWSLGRNASAAPVTYASPSFLSIIIPTMNERKNILACIDSIVSDPSIDHEIIVVDAGSTDGTWEAVMQRPAVRLITSDKGRGIQIRKGIAAAKGDTILILHADSRPDKTVIATLHGALRKHPHAAGGAFRTCYPGSQKRYACTTVLNDARTFFTGISFGDQAQFFRKAAIGERFPAYKLMEDIGLSILMKERGTVLFLSRSIENSTRKWERDGYVYNFIVVMALTTLYIVQRRFGLLSQDCGEFYRRYYHRKPAG